MQTGLLTCLGKYKAEVTLYHFQTKALRDLAAFAFAHLEPGSPMEQRPDSTVGGRGQMEEL